MVLVLDPRLAQRTLQADGIGPRVLRPADAPSLADVEQVADAGLMQGGQERVERPSVYADRHDPLHPVHDATGSGQALVRTRYVSIDPKIRTWMDDVQRWLPPIGIDEVVRSAGVGEVVTSNSDQYKVGELVFGMPGWQDYALADAGSGT